MAGIERIQVGGAWRVRGAGLAAALAGSTIGLVLFAASAFDPVMLALLLAAGGLAALVIRLLDANPFHAWAVARTAAAAAAEARLALERLAVEPLRLAAAGATPAETGPDLLAGTGIAWDGARLYLVDEGEAAAIPWEAIQGWRCSVTPPPPLPGLSDGPLAWLRAVAGRRRAAAEAARRSGLFVEVADLAHPVWRFAAAEAETLQEWAALLDQVRAGQAAPMARAA